MSGRVAPVTAPTAESPYSPTIRGPQLVHQSPQPVGSDGVPAGRSCTLGGPRVRRAHECRSNTPRRPRAANQRLERVAAQQRVGGEGVDAETGCLPERSRGLANQRLGVGARGDGDVAALAVARTRSPCVPRDRDDRLERRRPGAPRRSKHAS